MVESEYAKAIYELAKEEKKIDLFSESLSAVIDTASSDFMEILSSPFINKEQKKDILKKVYASFDETFLHFLFVLVDHNRFASVKTIKEAYDKLVLQEKNVVCVYLESAKKLTASELKKIKDVLSVKYTDKTIEINNVVKPELIGGVRVIAGEEAIDASAFGILNKLRDSL